MGTKTLALNPGASGAKIWKPGDSRFMPNPLAPIIPLSPHSSPASFINSTSIIHKVTFLQIGAVAGPSKAGPLKLCDMDLFPANVSVWHPVHLDAVKDPGNGRIVPGVHSVAQRILVRMRWWLERAQKGARKSVAERQAAPGSGDLERDREISPVCRPPELN